MSLAQNSGETAARPHGRPFLKGVSGNPGGRPRGFVQTIREATAEGTELVDFMLRVLRGKVPGVRLRDRLEAATWLADRGFGKPAPAPPPDAGDARVSLETLRGILSASSEPGKVYDG
jgi:hypothetical protein